jgi:tetratricopeptide (TPR) repeat protein
MKKLVALFVLLLTLACCTTEADRTRMRAGLDSINQRNRNDQPFAVQDVEPYVQFFDRHGTPNDRLLAHYLLGRAYHEQGEAPMALECYQKAAECADTTSKDCDYRQLCKCMPRWHRYTMSKDFIGSNWFFSDLPQNMHGKVRIRWLR